MLIWDLNPILLSLGPLEIRWYGLVYALGFILGYYVLKRSQVLTKKQAEDYIFLLVMGSIIMARLFYVFVYNPSYYLSNLGQIPAVWQGGLSIHGGLLGAVLVTWYFCRKHGIGPYDIVDRLVAPLALVLVFGRMANYVNGELPGTTTSVPWCVMFPGVEGCRHPSQLYEAGYSLLLFFILYLLGFSKSLQKGVLTWTFIGLYGLFRFLTTFFRLPDPSDPVLLGIAIGQWLSLIMVALSVAWFLRNRPLFS